MYSQGFRRYLKLNLYRSQSASLKLANSIHRTSEEHGIDRKYCASFVMIGKSGQRTERLSHMSKRNISNLSSTRLSDCQGNAFLLGGQLLVFPETLNLQLLASGTAVHITDIIWEKWLVDHL